MRKSWAEYKREQRQRERAGRRAEIDRTRRYIQTPFSEFLGGRGVGELVWRAAALGDTWWCYDDDSGLQPQDDDALAHEDLGRDMNSIGKAELVIDLLIDSAKELARAVNAYKRTEIHARISEIEQSTSNTEPKVLDDLERLKKIRYLLDRQVRETFPQWKVTGE